MDRRRQVFKAASLALLALLFSQLTASAANTCTPPPSGMVSWWPGDGNANDIAGSNNGSLQGATTTTGLIGSAFSFDGQGGYVRVADHASLDLTSELTLDAWIFADADGPATEGIISKYYPVDG